MASPALEVPTLCSGDCASWDRQKPTPLEVAPPGAVSARDRQDRCNGTLVARPAMTTVLTPGGEGSQLAGGLH